MNEPANTMEHGLSRQDSLGMQAKAYTDAIMTNCFQLGRVLCEARSVVPNGRWNEWLSNYTGMSERSAQNYMNTWRRFGNLPEYSGLEKTKLFRLLSLPENTQEEFMASHDVKAMSSRELEQAVKDARQEERLKAEAEREQLRMQLKQQIDAVTEQRDGYYDELQDLSKKRQEELKAKGPDMLDQMKAASERAIAEKNDAVIESNKLRCENSMLEDMLKQKQKEYDDVKQQLLDAQSQHARGEAEHPRTVKLDIDSFSGAVSLFMGACASMPCMDFYNMDQSERREYEVKLSTIENWCKESRKAMNTMEVIS